MGRLIKELREGPPIWSPWAIPVLGDKANLAEFFVHHEDIRRPSPSGCRAKAIRLVTTHCGTR